MNTPDPIAEIDIVEVARIAAAIPSSVPAFEKIREAYHLLNIAHEVKCNALKRGHRPLRVMKEWEEDLQEVEETPIWAELDSIKQRGADGEALTVPLIEGLKAMMPKVKPAIRKKRFADFLTTPMGEDYGMGLNSQQAAKKLAYHEKEPIPWSDFTMFFIAFRKWWPLQKKRSKSKAGKAPKTKPAPTCSPQKQHRRKRLEKNLR